MISVDPDAIRFLKPPHGPVDHISKKSTPVIEATPTEPAESAEVPESEATEVLSSSDANANAASQSEAAEASTSSPEDAPTSSPKDAPTLDTIPSSEAKAETVSESASEQAETEVVSASEQLPTPFHLPQYASPWLFVPAYIEVSFKTCSAIYVRHPTARPGYSEIPTPYDADGAVIRFAWEWYVHRRPRMRSQSQLARMPEDRVVTLEKEKIAHKDRRSFNLNRRLYKMSERPWRSSIPPHMDVAAGVGIGKRTLAKEQPST